MKKLTVKYEDNLKKDLLDPVEAAEYLERCIERWFSRSFFNGLERYCRCKGYF
jgi:hypothetical protein